MRCRGIEQAQRGSFQHSGRRHDHEAGQPFSSGGRVSRATIKPGAGPRQAFLDWPKAVAAPLAAGEQLGTKWTFRSLIEEKLVDYTCVDPCIAAGFTESRKIIGRQPEGDHR
jgi:hypothetical protein